MHGHQASARRLPRQAEQHLWVWCLFCTADSAAVTAARAHHLVWRRGARRGRRSQPGCRWPALQPPSLCPGHHCRCAILDYGSQATSTMNRGPGVASNLAVAPVHPWPPAPPALWRPATVVALTTVPRRHSPEPNICISSYSMSIINHRTVTDCYATRARCATRGQWKIACPASSRWLSSAAAQCGHTRSPRASRCHQPVSSASQ